MVMIGVDYASVDGNAPPDFNAARTAGTRFAVPRAVYGRSVQGQTYPGPFRDPVFARDAQRIRDAGLTLGAYLFLCVPKKSVKTTPTPEEQVEALVNYAKLAPGDFPHFVDVEEQSDLLHPAEYYDWVLRACRAVRSAIGTWPGIYTSQRVWTEYLQGHPAGELIDCPLWIAKPWPLPVRSPAMLDGAPKYQPYYVTPWGNQWLHYQYQGDATGWPGFSSTVDGNRFNVMQRGLMDSDGVKYIQRKLNTYLLDPRHNITPLVVDGDFGEKTEIALKSFQTTKKITADGIYGAKSHAYLAWLASC